MLSNAYFLAKIRFDTAENEPAKNLQKISKIWFREPARSGQLTCFPLSETCDARSALSGLNMRNPDGVEA